MKKSYLIIGMAGALLAPNLHATLAGDTAVLLWNPSYPNGGGPFEATLQGTYASSFNTFCLSIDTTFSPGTTYYYEVSPTLAVTGGVPPGATQVTLGTAVVYSQYLAGKLNSVTPDAVQDAIWYYQGLLTGTVDTESGNNLAAGISAVQTAIGLDDSAVLFASSGGAGGINALNLYSGNDNGTGTGISQPQLIDLDPSTLLTAPVPEASTLVAGALMLLPFGVSTIRIMRKKMIA